MKFRIRPRAGLAVTIALLAGVFLIVSVSSAFAWGFVNIHQYHFWAHNNTGQPVNDAQVWVTGASIPPWPPVWQPPGMVRAWCGPPANWPLTGIAPVGIWRRATWGPAMPWVNPSTSVWFNVDVRMVGWGPIKASTAWHRYTVNGVQVGPWRWLGWRIGSPPTLHNPELGPDGTNTQSMVVRDLQFAVSPRHIPNDSTTLDNPVVTTLFAQSLDPVRPGPFTVSPGGVHDITDLHASILEPLPGGRTVLVKGRVQDQLGDAQWFLVQFVALAETPGVSGEGLVILALVLAALGAFILVRRESARRRVAA